jgi:hypothetical protein
VSSGNKIPKLKVVDREKSLKDTLAKNKEKSDFLDRLTKEVRDLGRENLTSASVVGVFTVYTGLLESRIKSFLSTVYLWKSHIIRGDISLERNNDFSGYPLKKLSDELKTLKFYNKNTKDDYLSDFVTKLDTFKGKRNKIIHNMLNGELNLDKKSFEKEITLAHKELSDLLSQIEDLNKRVNKLYKLNGSFENFIKTIIDRGK